MRLYALTKMKEVGSRNSLYMYMHFNDRYMKQAVYFLSNMSIRKLRQLFQIQSIGYLLYAQAVLQLSFSDQIDSGVKGPLVLAGKDDVGSIEPGHLGNFVINITSVKKKIEWGQENVHKKCNVVYYKRLHCGMMPVKTLCKFLHVLKWGQY